jgi:rusticyanin
MAIAAAVVAAAIGATLAITLGGSSGNSSSETSYAYYQSMMGRFGLGGGSMMGGSDYGWMMGNSGYGWMMGGASVAPQWMQGQRLPGFMMGTSTDMGQVMGRLFADAPGPRVSPTEAAALGNQVPAGATVAKGANRITFAGSPVQLTVVASPPGNPDETFRAAGLVNPTIVVPRGAQVTLTLVNADPDTAHGVVVTSTDSASSSFMPMMTAPEAFSGAAVWFLGNPTSAGMHEGSMTFIASAPGTYQYLCPVPGHAQKGMVGSLVVES